MNSEQWWSEVKKEQNKFNHWLQTQYFGEMKATERIGSLISVYNLTGKTAKIISRIASDEANHAKWVLELLKTRGVTPPTKHEERYWKKVGLSFNSALEAFAVASHAENMRLEKLQVIANDKEAPSDIRKVFKKILKDEVFHESAFKKLTSQTEYEKAKDNHIKGRIELGLEA